MLVCALALVGGVIAHAAETNAVEVAFGAPAAEFTPPNDLNGEKVLINDRVYVLLDETEFENLRSTLKMFGAIAAKRWTIQHATEQGRREWHGKKIGTTFDEVRKERVTEYEDGYKHIEPYDDLKTRKRDVSGVKPVAPAPVVSKFAKPRRLREAEERAKQVVNVEFTPEGVKEVAK